MGSVEGILSIVFGGEFSNIFATNVCVCIYIFLRAL